MEMAKPDLEREGAKITHQRNSEVFQFIEMV
jgi:hypothetical protein